MNDRSVKQRQDVEQMRRFDAICDRFEEAWQDGEQPRISEYLGDESGEDRLQLARQLLEVDIEQRKAARQPVSVEDYSGEFPPLVSWLRQQLELTTGPDETPRKHGPSVVEADDPFLGTVLGSYELTEKLGAGGMGVVYRARHTMIECERAVKLLHPQISRDPATVKRFLLEAQTCITLNHPNVVTTYHVDQSTDGSIYIVMELLGGSSLDKVVTARDPMDIMDAAKIVAQAASGLAAAHRHGVIHRDIKPHNIMWNRSAAKILDLGLVRLLESESEPGPSNAGPVSTDGTTLSLFRTRLTEPNALMGTLPYMAPEQAEDAGVADERSDIYSLGCTFYFLLTGVHPFRGNSVEEIVDKHCQADFVPVSQLRQGVPERIQQILARMMDRQRDRRYQAAEAIAEDLLRWQQEAEAGAVRSAVALDDLHALREALLRLELVSSKDWETASTRVDEIEQGRVPSRLSHTMVSVVSDMPHADKATQMLQQLQRLQSYEGETHGLSEFQTRHIIGGNADLLRLPRHVLLNQIGNGWKGEVFAARNIAENRVEAMRTFAAGQLEGLSGIGSERMSSFREALDKRSQLNHAALPAILDSGSYQHRLHGDVAYFTTEYIDGTTLADLVSDGRFSDGREATRESCIRLLIEVCQVLQHVHDQGFLHLDLHPRCIRVDAAGRLKLLDVGVANMLHPKPAPEMRGTMALPRSASWRSTASTAPTYAESEPVGTMMFQPPPIGTAAIMPPEQWQRRGTATVQIDIYNLGCTLYYVITGELPFGGDGTLDLMQQHLSVDPVKSKTARQISKPYKEILRRTLAKDPTARYASAAELGEALDACSSKKADSGATSWTRWALTKLTGRR